MMVAGEASADRHASRVIRELNLRFDRPEIFGMGGPMMEAEGMECIYKINDLSVMGFSDVFSRLKKIFRVYTGVKGLISERKPDILIPVDLPDFNMGIAKRAKACGVKVLYYIAPQAWAWRRYRAKTLSRITDGLAVIFPFEQAFFSSRGVNARYVGHPLLEDNPAIMNARWPVERIMMLPGSRDHEIIRMLPVMLKAREIMDAVYPGRQWFLPLAPGIDKEQIRSMPGIQGITLTASMVQADLAMVKSGTASFEASMYGIPEVICYATSPMNYYLARFFVRMEYIGMPNIVAKKQIAPELIQGDLTPQGLAKAMMGYMDDVSQYQDVRRAFGALRAGMGTKKASYEVAEWAGTIL
ncbi:MAG: lipid-A-disaccharide synthase [Thermodesulfobacteriota bacterium]|nr:lipid-A-disaccharide synthase [Thermodesulfobacteriota bacterium]